MKTLKKWVEARSSLQKIIFLDILFGIPVLIWEELQILSLEEKITNWQIFIAVAALVISGKWILFFLFGIKSWKTFPHGNWLTQNLILWICVWLGLLLWHLPW